MSLHEAPRLIAGATVLLYVIGGFMAVAREELSAGAWSRWPLISAVVLSVIGAMTSMALGHL